MTESDLLKRGREAFRQHEWQKAYDILSAAGQESAPEPGDLERLAKAAYLIGKDAVYTDLWRRAHQGFLNNDEVPEAANCAFWLGLILFFRGDKAQGGGWIARARRLIDESGRDCPEKGFVQIPQALQHMRDGNPAAAYKLFSSVVELGKHFKNPDLQSLGQLGSGQALIQMNKTVEGTSLLDESMVAVLAGETSPIVSGIIYCAVIETCQKIYDLHRAQEWTNALSSWCEAHPDLFPYRGQCMVRRAELLQLHGEWTDAELEIQRACEHFSKSSLEVDAGEAFYRYGEISRLQGKYTRALDMYRQASRLGFKPQPGLALLRLAQGQTDVARAAIEQTEKEKKDPLSRSKILPAYLEIMIETEEIRAAQRAADELAEIAAAYSAAFLEAVATRAQGNLLLVSGKPADAMAHLHRASTLFTNSKARYESARTRVLIGLACRELGDADTAKMEFESAGETFEHIGAIPDLKSVNKLWPQNFPHRLTPRELEVLRLLATGKKNKEIAADLFLSERTIDRHVSNILTKIDAPTRAAATAYAYKYQLA